MLDVDHVVPALASHLASTDVHRRHAEKGTFTNGHAGVADDRRGPVQQPEKVLGKHVAEEVEVVWLLLLAKNPNALRRAIRPRVHIRPEPQHRQPGVLDGIQRRVHLLPRFLVLRRHRMLHDDQVALREILARPDAPVSFERVEVELRLRCDLRGDVDRRTPREHDRVRLLAQLDHSLAGKRRRHQMEVGELRDGVPHLLVDRTGHFAALHVHDGNVHVGRGDGRRQRLVPVGDGDHGIRLEVVEHGGQLDESQSRGLRRRDEILALEHHVDAGRRLRTRRARSPESRCRIARGAPTRRRRAGVRDRGGPVSR